jgi:hypothetical protein
MILAALIALVALGGIAAFVALQMGGGASNPSTAASPPAAQAGGATTAQPSAAALAGGNGAQAKGALLWNDLALHNDSVTISVSGLPAPNTGEVYAAWLASDTNSLAFTPTTARSTAARTAKACRARSSSPMRPPQAQSRSVFEAR